MRWGKQDLPAAPATNSLIGRIEVPRIGLSAIVLEGAGTETLRLGLGHIPRTALPSEPGNVGVAGHRDTFFRSLRHIHRGDQIVITTARGRYQYRVTALGIVKPTDTWVLDNSASVHLTLVTCYPFYFLGAAPDRFVVRAQQF